VIEAQVGHNPVNPGVEGTLEPEAAYVFVGLEERVLINILSVLLRSGEMKSEPQHRLIVMTNEFLEGGAASALGLPNEHRVIDAAILSLTI
jgi:hypothetical protein